MKKDELFAAFILVWGIGFFTGLLIGAITWGV